METITLIIHATTFSACLFLAYYVYVVNKNHMVNRLFSLFLLSMAGWVVTLYLFYQSTQSTVLLLGRLNFVFTELLAFSGFYFGYYFPKRSFQFPRKLQTILILWLISLISITLFTDLIDRNEIIKGTGDIVTEFGPLYFLFFLHVVLSLFGMVLLPVIKYKASSFREKRQIVYLVLGAAMLFAFGITTNIVMPFIFNYYQAQIFGPVGLFFLFGFTSYAIVKHQLMSIVVVIQRSLIYSAVLATIVSFYLLLLLSLSFVLEQMTGLRAILAAAVTMVLGIYSVPIIEAWFRKKTDSIFFKDKYDYSQALYELSEILNRNIEFKVLLKELSAKLKDILKTEKVCILLPQKNLICRDNGEIEAPSEKLPPALLREIEKAGEPLLLHADIPDMITRVKANRGSDAYVEALVQADHLGHKYGVAATVAVLLDDKLKGLIQIGPKMSGDAFSSEDINLLKTLSYQSAVAFEKAGLFEQVREYSGQLEKRVEERTAEIKCLQESQKQMMLEIAHGLQTPLTIIKGEISQVSKNGENGKMIQSFERSIDRISKFIYDMLRLARLENDIKGIKKEPLDLSDLVQELTETFVIVTQEKNIAIKYSIEPGITILAAKNELEELVMNLVSNCVKYMDDSREKTIAISLASVHKRAVLAVADTGIGIAPANLTKIFNRFYRVNSGAGAESKGTGLGLAIVKEIVERHQGDIKVESELGKGTKITMTFPLA